MCIGVPLQVESLESHDGDEGLFALCTDGTQRERLDMRLVGRQAPGTWVLSFLGAARRVLDPVEAAQIRDALQALHVALQDDPDPTAFDALFADLINREPQLPPHLQAQAAAASGLAAEAKAGAVSAVPPG
jgi:hydrogenase expression/formation protein HypC